MTVLVIVESPAKSKKIKEILGKGYSVAASVGHIRDLPAKKEDVPAKYAAEKWARTGVDVDSGYRALYVVPKDKREHIKKLRELATGASQVLLATDADREGEAIAWHLIEELKLRKGQYQRMTFQEITKDAILDAVKNTRDLDTDLVQAQEARRIIDRLYGYEVSPALWRMVAGRLSAGRVQSVATRLVVQRERERLGFKTASFAKLDGRFAVGSDTFSASLSAVMGKKLATGKDYDPTTGALRAGADALHLSRPELDALVAALPGGTFTVEHVEDKPFTRRPAPPFTTSTLAQEASRRFKWSTRKTAQVAQQLYEAGAVTYIRTDSPHLSEEAIEAARTRVEDLFGAAAVPAQGRQYAAKKGAQEAHEAIRPSGKVFKTPDEMKNDLDADGLKLYTLVYERTLASQMGDARGTSVIARIRGVLPDGREVTFTARGLTITDPGFMRLYQDTREEGEPENEDDSEARLPALTAGQGVTPQTFKGAMGTTQPPGRFTEATLVQALEKGGIGRPSTFASIMGTIQERGYVVRTGNHLSPTWTGLAVTQVLEGNVPELVDVGFTAQMERQLDEVAEGRLTQTAQLDAFYRGETGLAAAVLRLKKGEIAPALVHPALEGSDLTVRVGPAGTFVLRGDRQDDSAKVPDGTGPADLTAEVARTLLSASSRTTMAEAARVAAATSREGLELGEDPHGRGMIKLKNGRFGPYLEVGEGETVHRASVPETENADTLTPERAAMFLALNRVLGEYRGHEVRVGLGKYGPYIKNNTDFRSVPLDEAVTIELDAAIELLNQPKKARPESSKPAVRKQGPRRGNG